MKRALFLFALLLFPACLAAQQPDCLHRTVPVSVIDKQLAPVTNLTAENFSGSFRSAPVKIVTAKLNTSPKRIVILLDLSGSMRAGFRYRAGAFVAAHMLAALPEGSRVALITFADNVTVQTKQLQDAQTVLEFLRKIAEADREWIRGSTSFWPALEAAVAMLEPHQPGDAIYAITDGQDNSSQNQQSAQSRVEASLLSEGIRLFATVFDDDLGGGSLIRMTPAVRLTKMAENTGGSARKFEVTQSIWSGDRYDLSEKGQKRIREAADSIAKQIAQLYFVDFELPEQVDKARSLKLELVAGGQQQIKDLKLYYPKQLFPCSAARAAQQLAPR